MEKQGWGAVGFPRAPHPGEEPKGRGVPPFPGHLPRAHGRAGMGLGLCTNTQPGPCAFRGTPVGRTPPAGARGVPGVSLPQVTAVPPR